MSETLNAPAIDKTAWGPGPWQDEPDRVDFVHAGFACLIIRHFAHGHLCGYVAVPPDHPRYEEFEHGDLEAHHGVNYADKCSGDVCHVPAPGMPDDVWWLGFDCGHVFDLSPGSNAYFATLGLKPRIKGPFREVYRELPYVHRVVEHLAEQLAEESPKPCAGSGAVATVSAQTGGGTASAPDRGRSAGT